MIINNGFMTMFLSMEDVLKLSVRHYMVQNRSAYRIVKAHEAIILAIQINLSRNF